VKHACTAIQNFDYEKELVKRVSHLSRSVLFVCVGVVGSCDLLIPF